MTTTGDQLVLQALRKAAGRSVPDQVWDQITAQVERVGVRGLTGSSRTIIEDLVRKHGHHDQSTHGNWAAGHEHDPESGWIHDVTWYHGTSTPGLKTIDAGQGPARYSGMSSGYAAMRENFATTDFDTAVRYAEDAAEQDRRAGNANAEPVVYRVVPTSDEVRPDPNSGPMGFGDGPEDMAAAYELLDNGLPVDVAFGDPLQVVEEFSGRGLNVRKHGTHDQSTHGNWAKGSEASQGSGVGAPSSKDGSWGAGSTQSVLVPTSQSFKPATRYEHSSGTTLIIGDSVNPQAHEAIKRMYGRRFTELQERAPIPNTEVCMGDEFFAGLPDMTSGYCLFWKDSFDLTQVQPLDSGLSRRVHIRPPHSDRTWDPRNTATMNVPDTTTYTLTHEWGHLRDRRDAFEARKDFDESTVSAAKLPFHRTGVNYDAEFHKVGMSSYAVSDFETGGQGREAYAEAFAGWMYGIDSDFVRYYADRYNWDAAKERGDY